MDDLTLMITTYIIVAVIVIIVVLLLMKRKRLTNLRQAIEKLDKEKNIIESAPVLLELAKVETIIKNDMLEEKYKTWQERYENIKNVQLSIVNDKIIDLDIFIDNRDYKGYEHEFAKTEIEVAKAKTAMNKLLEEINDLNSSEEKYRSIITKLKSKYRELNVIFDESKEDYEDISDIITLQFENIEKRFQDFEELMEKNEYSEVMHIVKAIDTMVDHMIIVITEVPDLVLLAKKLIPKRIEQITESYEELINKDFPIKYLNIEYNVEESLKNVNKIIDRIKVLNLEDCMFELRTMLEYLDSLFAEFDKEKQAKKTFEEEYPALENKLGKVKKVVNDIYGQLNEIKNTYDLKDEDLAIIDEVNNRLNELNSEFETLNKEIEEKENPYSRIVKEIESLTNKLVKLDDDLDVSLKSLGNMYEDEMRAREQLDEIQELLNQSKVKIRSYKLPVISKNYFIQLSEANEAILEIIKELEKKPISILVLNTRVDTARDLVLKLYNTTNEMIKTARLAEDAIIYGNRFRAKYDNINEGLTNAEVLFYKGSYKKSLEISFAALDSFDPGIKTRLMHSYSNDK